MSSPKKETEEPTSSTDVGSSEVAASGAKEAPASEQRPPAKRRLSSTVIEISDTESDDSDVCAVTSYQASADEVKRIRGDYSSTSSSSSDSYSSDSESSCEDDSLVVSDSRPLGKLSRAQLYPRADRTEDPQLNPTLKAQDVIDRLTTHWKEEKNLSSTEVTLTCEPFRLCLLHDLLSNPNIINNIVDDMNTLDWTRKKMDLFEFHQTVDLASLTWQRSIKGIYELLKTEVMSWVSQVTGLELVSVSASCSLYGPGDHLLVHDDLLADRRVAFILYLAPWQPRPSPHSPSRSPSRNLHNGDGDHGTSEQERRAMAARGWTARLGGALELLARGPDGLPSQVQHRVLPQNNMLAFFKVGVDSFHQVGEVVSLELPRLSINGWFHGPTAPPPPPPLPPPPDLLRPHNDVVVLQQWVEAAYMSPATRAQVQAQMERESEVCLRDFLLRDKLDTLLEALKGPEVEWESAGPANLRRYWRVCPQWAASRPEPARGAGHPVRELLRVCASAAWLRLLHDCTDLALRHYHSLELQRWRPADYTLLPPRDSYLESRLQLVLYLGVPLRALCGGATTFLAPEEEGAPGEALVTAPAQDNALTLVYCDAGAACFTKYLSRMTMRDDECFYILTCTYKE